MIGIIGKYKDWKIQRRNKMIGIIGKYKDWKIQRRNKMIGIIGKYKDWKIQRRNKMINIAGKRKWWVLTSVLLVAALLSLSGLQIANRSQVPESSILFGIGDEKVVTLGHVAYAAGDVDYTFDGVADDVQFQAALASLPAAGGRLVVVSATQINFVVPVTRAIDNVSIVGSGAGTYFTNDAVTDLFVAGGDNWTFSDLRTDAGSIDMGATTDWSWENVTIATAYYAYRTPVGSTTAESWEIPVGRGATYVIAASDAPAQSIAQADYVCDGTADEVEIQAAIDEIVATTGGEGLLLLTPGTFNIAAEIHINSISELTIAGSGWGTIVKRINAMPVSTTIVDYLWGNIFFFYACDKVQIKDLAIDGNYTNQTYSNNGNHPGDWFPGGYAEDFYNDIWFCATTNSVISNVYLYDGGTNNIRIGSTDSLIIETAPNNNKVMDCLIIGGRNGILTYGSSSSHGNNTIISGNHLYDGLGFAGIYLYSNNDIVSGNYVEGYYNASEVQQDGIRLVGADNTLVTNNVVFDNDSSGILVFQACAGGVLVSNNVAIGNLYGISMASTHTTVIGNVCKENTSAGISVQSGATLSSVLNNRCTANLYGVRTDADNVQIKGNTLDGNGYSGIHIANSSNINISENSIFNNEWNEASGARACIYIDANLADCEDIDIRNNLFSDTRAGASRTERYAVYTWKRAVVIFENNTIRNLTTGGLFIWHADAEKIVRNNTGYIFSGNMRSVSGTLTAGVADAIGFAWHNPEAQDILITKVVIEITTGSVTANSVIDVGIADDAAGTNRGVEFFDDLDANDVDINDSWVAGDGGTQTKYVLCQDSASATDGWVVGQILVADAAALAGKYYIEYVGR